MDTTKYVRLCRTVNTVGELITLEDYNTNLQSYLDKNPESDWYTSVYYYSKEAKDYFDKNGRLKDYVGPAYTSTLLFDFDNQDLNYTKETTIRLLEKLQSEGVDVVNSCRIYFSGNKGFHVQMFTEKLFNPSELKNICKNIIVSLDPKYTQSSSKVFDPTVYNLTRLIRIPNTKHQESGLYKIELEPSELLTLTIDQIKQKAKEPRKLEFQHTPVKNIAFLDKYMAVKTKPIVSDNTHIDISGIRGLNSIDYSSCPKNTPRCIYALSHGVMQSGIGERNTIFLRLAAFYKNQGMTKDVCYNTLKGIARENASLYPDQEAFTKEEIWNTVINSVYSENTNWKQIPGAAGTDAENEILKRYCKAIDNYTDKKCCLHDKVENKQQVVHISNVADSFGKFANDFDNNTVKTGIKFVDNNMNIAIGTTNLLVGAAGSSKTTLLLNILENSNSLNQHSVFFSADMHKNLIYLKLAKKATGFNQDQIINFYKTGDKRNVDYVKAAIEARYGKTYFDFTSTLTLDEMKEKIFDIEQKIGNKVKLVGMDYAGRIAGPFADSYANATYNALRSSEIAAVTDAAWLILSQISRATGDGCAPLRTKRAAKDSGTWEESASNVITIWRPWMGNTEKDQVVRMFLAKNRMGKELETVLVFNGEKGEIRDMTEDEHLDYVSNQEALEKDFYRSKFKV